MGEAETRSKIGIHFLLNSTSRCFGDPNILEIVKLNKSFGGLHAVHDVSLKVKRGEVLGLIGPNGAGKTTIIQLISGLLKADSGTIKFNGRPIQRLPAHSITLNGIGRTFQIVQIFQRMTVEDNLIVPGLSRLKDKIEIHEQIEEVLEFLKLEHLKEEYAGNLSGGQQKLLELGRALMLNSELYLLDEPFVGVHPKIRIQIHKLIEMVNSTGKTFVVISHDMKSIFKLCERIIVLSSGSKIAEGTPSDIRHDERVLEAYLGD